MTLEQIRAMSDDEIIRAIAPLQGFSVVSEANRRKDYHFSADERDRIYGFIVDSRGRRKGKIKPIPAWATDLNAAMSLVPSIDLTVADAWGGRNFFICLAEVVCPKELDGEEPLKPSDMDDKAIIGVFGVWFFDCADRARKICEAFMSWKGSAT